MTLALVASATVVVSAGQAAAEPTEIAECGVIDEPGNYVLTEDMIYPRRSIDEPGPCLSIQASDVTIDGNGHTVNASEGSAIVVGGDSTVRNVSIRDVTASGRYEAVKYENVTDGRLTNVTTLPYSGNEDMSSDGVDITNSEGITVRGSTIAAGFHGNPFFVGDSDRITIINNTFVGPEDYHWRGSVVVNANKSTIRDNEVDTGQGMRINGRDNLVADNQVSGTGGFYTENTVSVAGRNTTFVNNSLTAMFGGITVTGQNHTVAENHVRLVSDNEQTGVDLAGSNHTVESNRIVGNATTGVAISGSAPEIAHNDIDLDRTGLDGNSTGVLVEQLSGTVSVHHNRISAHGRVHQIDPQVCVPNPEANTVDLHENTFVAWDGKNAESAYAVLNENDVVVNATDNYWGASDGPSSYQGETVSDPETGEPADGSGGNVSEGVHFDPWLDQPTNETGPTESND